MTPPDSDNDVPRLAWLGGSSGMERLLKERTWPLEQRVQELERERQDLLRILRGLGEGVVAVDRAGIVIHANPTAIELLRLDAATCLGNHMFVAVPEPAMCDLLEDVMRGEGRLTRELVIERPEGDTVLAVAVRSLRRSTDDEEPEGAIAVVRDVTELRRLGRARQDFFSNVSHELKTPVTAILGAIETILDDPAMPADTRDRFLDGARSHTLRLGRLVTDLLELARYERGPRALEFAPVELTALVAQALDALAPAAAPRSIALEASTSDGDPFVVDADAEAIRVALDNLVDNAIAHSEDGSTVRVVLTRDASTIRIDVVDDGTGIPIDALDRVFERFYRADADRSRARGGTGIGLSIVKHVAQAHGGSVSATSEPGVGSTFSLVLPVSQPRRRGTDLT